MPVPSLIPPSPAVTPVLSFPCPDATVAILSLVDSLSRPLVRHPVTPSAPSLIPLLPLFLFNLVLRLHRLHLRLPMVPLQILLHHLCFRTFSQAIHPHPNRPHSHPFQHNTPHHLQHPHQHHLTHNHFQAPSPTRTSNRPPPHPVPQRSTRLHTRQQCWRPTYQATRQQQDTDTQGAVETGQHRRWCNSQPSMMCGKTGCSCWTPRVRSSTLTSSSCQ